MSGKTTRKRILMCGPAMSVKGGMTSVIQNYRRAPWGEFEIVYLPTYVEKKKWQVSLYFFAAYWKALALYFSKRCCAVYLHTAEKGSFFRKAILALTFHAFGAKIVFHHHAAEFEPFYERLPDAGKQFVRRALEMADQNFVLSGSFARWLREKAPGARVTVLYNAVPVFPENPYCADATRILFLGRLGERKGTYDLLQAIERLDAALPQEISFLLCGDGETARVNEWIERAGLRRRVAHVGWIGREEKEKLLPQVMLHVLPSYHEGLPMSILETMARGIPNISTRIAAIPEVIRDGENGFLIEPGDVSALAGRIQTLCADRALRKKMSEAAWREISENFSLARHMETLLENLRMLFAQGNR